MKIYDYKGYFFQEVIKLKKIYQAGLEDEEQKIFNEQLKELIQNVSRIL